MVKQFTAAIKADIWADNLVFMYWIRTSSLLTGNFEIGYNYSQKVVIHKKGLLRGITKLNKG